MATRTRSASNRKADDSSDAEAKRFKSDYNAIIDVFVGKCPRPFKVHEDLLFRHAPFLQSWPVRLSTTSKVIWIKKHRHDIFKLYLDRLYPHGADLATITRALVDSHIPVQELDEERHEDFRQHGLTGAMIDLWSLADAIGDQACKNSAIDALEAEPDEALLSLAFKNVTEVLKKADAACPLRDWVMDSLLRIMTLESLDEKKEELPGDFQYLFLRRMLEKASAGELVASQKPDPCRYHCHGPGEASCA